MHSEHPMLFCHWHMKTFHVQYFRRQRGKQCTDVCHLKIERYNVPLRPCLIKSGSITPFSKTWFNSTWSLCFQELDKAVLANLRLLHQACVHEAPCASRHLSRDMCSVSCCCIFFHALKLFFKPWTPQPNWLYSFNCILIELCPMTNTMNAHRLQLFANYSDLDWGWEVQESNTDEI